MVFDDTIDLKQVATDWDEHERRVEQVSWLALGRCVIFPNEAARQEEGEDTLQRVYQYTVVMRKPKVYPKEGDWVRLRKKDSSIDCEMRVRGFVTLKNRYLKLWL